MHHLLSHLFTWLQTHALPGKACGPMILDALIKIKDEARL